MPGIKNWLKGSAVEKFKALEWPQKGAKSQRLVRPVYFGCVTATKETAQQAKSIMADESESVPATTSRAAGNSYALIRQDAEQSFLLIQTILQEHE